MIRLGIIGGSGTGKTTVSELFKKEGVDIIDGDKAARIVVEPGKPALFEIAEYFGKEYINSDGTLNRRRLGNYVFSNPEELLMLNKITHKYITEYFNEYIDNCGKDMIGIDAAALIESGVRCDYIIAVTADRDIRTKRIVKRDGITEEEAKKRIDSQKNDEFYIVNADYIVYNNSDGTDLHCQVRHIIDDIRSKN